jgi:AraC-like DNA-binding protein
MLEELDLPPGLDGLVTRHARGDVRVRAHRHVEVEVNLVSRGTAAYLLGDRRYELAPGSLTWLFPGQEHVLVDQSADHELWWAVFTPALVRRAVGDVHTLLEDDPAGLFSRHVGSGKTRRLVALFEEVRAADDVVVANAGLGYLLVLAWRMFQDSDEVVDSTDLHPAVRAVARILRTDPNAGDLAALARAVSLSPTHLSRIFKAQTGIPLSRYRNQQRLNRFLLIQTQGRTTLAAALEAGFGSHAQFHRVRRQELS